MNISLENLDKVSALLTVKMEKADYTAQVDKALKNYRKKANIPGFRPGQAPLSLLKKRFGTEVKAEEVDKLLRQKISEYIRENNVHVLGEPMPNEERQKNLDLETMDDFEFVFDIALAPEINIELDKNDTVDYYHIDVDDKMIDSQVKMYAQRAGSYDKVENYEANDMVKGLLAELDENGNTKEGGIQVENAVVLPEYMKNDDQKAIFNGCKVNDVLVINPNQAYNGSEAEIAALLKIKKEDVANMTSNFSYQIQEITRFKEAELNQELFDQVFGKDVVKSEEEFRNKIKSIMTEQFAGDSDYKFILDMRTYLMNKIGKLEFADEILKRYMRVTSNVSKEKWDEYVKENYDKSIEELTWHLIEEQLVKKYEVKVDNDDLKNTAKNITKIQFAQYGMINVPENVLDNYANEMLKKNDQVESLINRSVENKLAGILKDVVTLNEKQTSVEDFNKMFA